MNYLECIRRQHDPEYSLIPPHFTLVFPVSTVTQNALIAHVAARTETVRVVPFIIQCAMMAKDMSSAMTHVFLAPDEGYSKLVRLRDSLYTDALTDALRLDVPFIPQITVGAKTDPRTCKTITNDINQNDIRSEGQVRALACLAAADAYSSTASASFVSSA